jgi:large subunit ribosomal protein L20
MRIKRGVTSHAKHKKVRAQTKGYSLVRRSSIRQAKQAILKALQYQYRDRRNKKRDLRSTWISRINAGVSHFGMSYSAFMGALKKSGIALDRKILAELAVNQPKAFEAIVVEAKKTK